MWFCALVLAAVVAAEPAASPAPAPWARRYSAGQTLRYRMEATNQGRRYAIVADATVATDGNGMPIERIAWSQLRIEDRPVELVPGAAAFRQVVSLAPGYINTVPPLAGLDRNLIGPVTDLVNFYSDLWLAGRMSAALVKPGERAAFPFGRPVSWADGTSVIIGEDAVDFEVILEALDPAAGTAAILVRHTPPERPAIRIPAAWMRAPVAGTANNWVEVQRLEGGRYAARIGQETFDDRLTVDLNDGKILRAELQNPVNAIERTCEEAALARCSAAAPLRIMRTVTLTLVR